MDITKRQTLILKAIVDDYILTGIPVGSRTLSKKEELSISSATIRNEMADLEESGYLEQPHTSAGRMPSDKAYRLYVDTLMRVSALSKDEIEFIKAYLGSRIGQIENIVDATAKVLSELTNLTSLVLFPQFANAQLRRVQVVRIVGKKALVIFVFNTGMVKDVLIDVPADMDEKYFEMISNSLTETVANRGFFEAAEQLKKTVMGEMNSQRAFMEMLLQSVLENIRPKAEKEVVLGGTRKILEYPEYQDVEKAKNFLSLLETKDTLYSILTQASDVEFNIKIGHENAESALQDMSVVTATYRIGDQKIGSFGVIGPTRMDYARIISVLEFVGASINEILKYHLDT